ncbi:MAG: thioredoxin [Candidatus Marinimicrobia bacterium]|nr:thioredoxin [Candidatus Neomarinimicrobiota bacterium]
MGGPSLDSDIRSIAELTETINSEPAALLYFSTSTCSVCKVLKPKVKALLTDDFPEIDFRYINIEEFPEVSGQFSVFTVPTILVYFDGDEVIRKSRNVGLSELASDINRPYQLFFH